MMTGDRPDTHCKALAQGMYQVFRQKGEGRGRKWLAEVFARASYVTITRLRLRTTMVPQDMYIVVVNIPLTNPRYLG